MILAATGIYSVMTCSVAERTREIGIRMALGADAARIFRMVMTQGAWQLSIGLVLGAGGIQKILTLQLSAEELAAFHASAETVRALRDKALAMDLAGRAL